MGRETLLQFILRQVEESGWSRKENLQKPYRLQPVGIMAQSFRSSEMPSMIHICLPNMTPYKSNIWHIQSMATISHNYASQAHRLTSLSYKNLTMSHSSLIHGFLSTNQTKRKDRRGQKQQRMRRYKQENNIRQSKTRDRRIWLAVFAAFYCSWYTEETNGHHSLQSLGWRGEVLSYTKKYP